jgi:hypothetical protein
MRGSPRRSITSSIRQHPIGIHTFAVHRLVVCDCGLRGFQRDNKRSDRVAPWTERTDLRRDGTYALHSFPCPDNEDAFSIAGHAETVADSDVRDLLSRQFVQERSQFPVMPPAPEDALFEFAIDGCLLTRTTGHGDPTPQHTIWHEQSTTGR